MVQWVDRPAQRERVLIHTFNFSHVAMAKATSNPDGSNNIRLNPDMIVRRFTPEDAALRLGSFWTRVIISGFGLATRLIALVGPGDYQRRSSYNRYFGCSGRLWNWWKRTALPP
jgi:hypothetical protein